MRLSRAKKRRPPAATIKSAGISLCATIGKKEKAGKGIIATDINW